MKTFLTALAAAGFAAVAVGIYHEATKPAPLPPAAQVAAATVPAPQPAKLSAPTGERALEGQIEPGAEVDVRPTLAGYPVHLKVDTGDFVQKGQVVVELGDARSLEESVGKAEIALRTVEADFQARATRTAQAERDPTTPLTSSQPQSRLNSRTAEPAPPSAAVKGIEEADRSRLAQAEAAVARAKQALAQTRIVSPISGFVVQRIAEAEISSPDLVLLRIADISTVKTTVHVPSDGFQKIVADQEARVTVDGIPERSFMGKVVRQAKAPNWRSQEAVVSIEIANANMSLRPGMYAHVRLAFDSFNEPRLVAQAFWLKKTARFSPGPQTQPAAQGDSELLASLNGLTQTMNTMAKEIETRDNATKITAQATQDYFNGLEKLVARMRDDVKTSQRKLSLEKAAEEIDDLPALHVDDELLTFGADVSKALREMAEQRRAVARENVVGDWALVDQTTRVSCAIKTRGLQRINNALADMRRKMIKRYNLEFLTTAEHNPSASHKDRRISRH